ncbi:unnamed protein product [Albugo candida]|uniref:Uncharacterized protein n=1 Tax=Albugo candida TaxID=65357 RepID=A0A024GR79_9STRA|nr:unnamed protein product [Albugo candida]|eukprot:CCI49293.1 unnamed protein product [Albugo candida]
MVEKIDSAAEFIADKEDVPEADNENEMDFRTFALEFSPYIRIEASNDEGTSSGYDECLLHANSQPSDIKSKLILELKSLKKSAGSRNTNEKQIHDTTRKANEKDRLSETSAITLSPPHDDNIGQLEKVSNTKDGEDHSSVNTEHQPNSGGEKKKAFFHHFHKSRQATLELAKKVFSRLEKAGR